MLCRIGGTEGVSLHTLHLHYKRMVLSGEGELLYGSGDSEAAPKVLGAIDMND